MSRILLLACSALVCAKGALAVKIECLGTPIRAVTFGNSHGLLARSPAGNEGMFYVPYYSTTGSALIGIHPGTGEHTTIKLGSSGGYGCTLGADGCIYVGGIEPGDLYRYDPVGGTVARLGGAQFGIHYLWDAATGPDGRIYGSGYPTCSVLEYNPASGALTDTGSLVAGKQYARSVCVDARGKVWVGTGTGGSSLVVLDAASGERKDVLPEKYRACSSAYDLHASGDYVFCSMSMPGALLVFDAKTQGFIREVPLPAGEVWWMCGASGADGVLYPYTAPGQSLYRYDAKTNKLDLLGEALGQAEVVVDDRYLHTIQDQDYVYYDFREHRELFRRRLAESGEGMALMTLVTGTDGLVYGSTYINQHIFSFSPEGGAFTDLGKVIRWGGQVDSMSAGRDGRIYMGSYVYANMSYYDPAVPWRPGRDKEANPRELGPVGKGQYRTRCIAMGPDGSVYMGSIPSYGSAPTGGFSRWDAKTDEVRCWTDFVPGGTVEDLRADARWVYGHGGGEFFVLDCAEMRKVFTARLSPSALEVAGNGRVLASVGKEIVVFDPVQMKLLGPIANPSGGLTEMCRLPDGRVGGINDKTVVEVDPEAGVVTVLANEGGSFITADRAGRLYFARGAAVYRLSR